MEKQKFNIRINAPKEKVWETLWNDHTYRQWTAPFTEGSHAESDWNEGSKIHFLDANGNGMFSIIDKKVPNAQMTFKHLGEIKDGEEKSSTWAGALESYSLIENGETTDLQVEMDTDKSFQEYFENTFPKALQLVKQLSENDKD